MQKYAKGFLIQFIFILINLFSFLSCNINPINYQIVNLYVDNSRNTDETKLSDEITGVIVGYTEKEEEKNAVTIIVATSSNALDTLLKNNNKTLEGIKIGYCNNAFRIKAGEKILKYDEITLVDEQNNSFKAITLLNVIIDTTGIKKSDYATFKKAVEQRLKESIVGAADFINNYRYTDNISQKNLRSKNYTFAGYYKLKPNSESVNGEKIKNVCDESITFSNPDYKRIKTSFNGGGIFNEKYLLAVIYTLNNENVEGMFFNFLDTYVYKPKPIPILEQGNIWIKDKEVKIGDNFTTDLYIHMGNNKLFEFEIEIYYGNGEIIGIDKEIDNNGITFLKKADLEKVTEKIFNEGLDQKCITITGKADNGIKTENEGKLLTIHWNAKTVGTIKLKARVNTLKNILYSDELYTTIKEIGIVKVKERKDLTLTPVPEMPTPSPLSFTEQPTPVSTPELNVKSKVWFELSTEKVNTGDIFRIDIYYVTEGQRLKNFDILIKFDENKINLADGNSGIEDSENWMIYNSDFHEDSIKIQGENIHEEALGRKSHLVSLSFKAIQSGITEIILEPQMMVDFFGEDIPDLKIFKKTLLINEIYILHEDEKKINGCVWGEPQFLKVIKSDPFETKIYANIDDNLLSSYIIEITYDKNIIISTDKWNSGIKAGTHEFFDYIQVDNNKGKCTIWGNTDKAVSSNKSLQLFTIFWHALEFGDAIIRINVRQLVDSDDRLIGNPYGNPILIKVVESALIPTAKIAPTIFPTPPPSPGNVLFTSAVKVKEGDNFETHIRVNTGDLRLSDSELSISFPSEFLQVDITKGDNGIVNINANTWFDHLYVDNKKGNVGIKWLIQGGLEPNKSLYLFRIHWKAIQKGIKLIKLTVKYLKDENNNLIGGLQEKICRVTIDYPQVPMPTPVFTPLPKLPTLSIIEPMEKCILYPGSELQIYGTFTYNLSDNYPAILKINNNQQEVVLRYLTDNYINIEDYWYYVIDCTNKNTGDYNLQLTIKDNKGKQYESNMITFNIKEKPLIINSPEYYRLVQEGIRKMKSCMFLDAVILFRNAHNNNYPGHADITLKLAQSEYYCDSIDKAENIINEMIISNTYDPNLNKYEYILEKKILLLYQIVNIKSIIETDNMKRWDYYEKAYKYLLFLFHHSKGRNRDNSFDNTFLFSVGNIIKNFMDRGKNGQANSIINEINISSNKIKENIDKIECLIYVLNLARLHFCTGNNEDEIQEYMKIIEKSQFFINLEPYFNIHNINITIDNIEYLFFYMNYYKFKLEFYRMYGNQTDVTIIHSRLVQIKEKLLQYTQLVNYLY